MNKISKKTLDILENFENYYRNQKQQLKRIFYIIEKIKKAINLENDYDSDYSLLDSYNMIEKILMDVCNLNDYETAFILNKIIQYNYKINNSSNHVLIKLEDVEKDGYDIDYIKNLFNKYNNDDPSLTDEETKLIEDITQKEKDKNLYIIESYSNIQDFSKKNCHSNEEFAQFAKSLKNIGLTPKLIDCYLNYYISKEKEEKETKEVPKKEVKQEIIPSRKVLKEQLSEYYHPDYNIEYFDLKNLSEVLKILKYLNVSDNRFEIILSDLYRWAIKNSAYYDCLDSKVEFLNKDKDLKILEEIRQIRNMIESYPSDIEELKKWINDLYSKIEFCMYESFDYEHTLMRKL